MARDTNLEIKQGNDYIIPIQADTDDVPVDFTGWSVTFMAKSSIKDADADAKINITVALDSMSGAAEIPIPATVTRGLPEGDMWYDCRLVNNEGKAGSTDMGTLTVEPVVNKGEA